MKPNEVVHLGDGAYLVFDGYGFELRANHHLNPTDRVYLERQVMQELIRLVNKTWENEA